MQTPLKGTPLFPFHTIFLIIIILFNYFFNFSFVVIVIVVVVVDVVFNAGTFKENVWYFVLIKEKKKKRNPEEELQGLTYFDRTKYLNHKVKTQYLHI